MTSEGCDPLVMQVKHTLTLPFARDVVWAALQDVAAVAACVPGASLTAPVVDGALQGAMAVKLGPIQARFAGSGTVAMDAASHTGSLSGSGADRASGSRAKGAVAFALLAEGAATRLDLSFDYELTGSLAQFGRAGIVQDLVGRIAQQFAANLGRLIAERQAAQPAPAAPPAPAARLDLWALLRGMIADWFRRLGRRVAGRS